MLDTGGRRGRRKGIATHRKTRTNAVGKARNLFILEIVVYVLECLWPESIVAKGPKEDDFQDDRNQEPAERGMMRCPWLRVLGLLISVLSLCVGYCCLLFHSHQCVWHFHFHRTLRVLSPLWGEGKTRFLNYASISRRDLLVIVFNKFYLFGFFFLWGILFIQRWIAGVAPHS